MKNIGKQIKDLGVMLIAIGVVSLLLALFPLISSDTLSTLYTIADRYFVWLLIGGLVEVMVGIITRSISKRKVARDRENS